jgi:signal transduction histidine kinase
MEELARLAQRVGAARDLLGVLRALRLYTTSLVGNNALFVSLLSADRSQRVCVYAWSDGEEVDTRTLPALPMTGGPHAQAVATGAVVVVDDLQKTLIENINVPLGYDRDPRAPNVSIALPLAVLGRVIGGFEVQIFEHADPRSCVPSLQVAANLAAVAIENVQLLEGERKAREELRSVNEILEQRVVERTTELARRVAQLTALGEVSHTISSNLNLAEVLEAVVSRAVHLSGAEEGAIFQFDASRQQLLYRASHGVSPGAEHTLALQPPFSPGGDDSLASAARAGSTLRLTDPSGVDAILVVPMLRAKQLAGVLSVRRSGGAEFSTDAIALLEAFAAQSAVAIHNAELFHELELRSAALELESRHKTTFLATMSHELRTPLNAIIGFSEVLLDHDVTEIPEDQRSAYLEYIRGSGRNLLGLINDILDVSKVEAGHMQVQLQQVQLDELVEGCVALIAGGAEKKHIRVETRCEPPDVTVEADPARLQQIICNLLSNAVKFTEVGGLVRVVAQPGARDEMVVTVSDTGIGVRLEDQALIFEPFRQAEHGTHRREQGTGLGLALARQLVELHGGKIWVESAPGQGSSFSFTLQAVGPEAD